MLGYEGDASITGRKDAAFEFPSNSAFSNEVRERWLSTFRGRVGSPRTTGCSMPPPAARSPSPSSDRVACPRTDCGEALALGLDRGGGVEVKFTHDWSAKVEYLYVGLQDKSYLQSGAERGVCRAISACTLDDHIVRVGVNYKLPWSVLDSFFKR